MARTSSTDLLKASVAANGSSHHPFARRASSHRDRGYGRASFRPVLRTRLRGTRPRRCRRSQEARLQVLDGLHPAALRHGRAALGSRSFGPDLSTRVVCCYRVCVSALLALVVGTSTSFSTHPHPPPGQGQTPDPYVRRALESEPSLRRGAPPDGGVSAARASGRGLAGRSLRRTRAKRSVRPRLFERHTDVRDSLRPLPAVSCPRGFAAFAGGRRSRSSGPRRPQRGSGQCLGRRGSDRLLRDPLR